MLAKIKNFLLAGCALIAIGLSLPAMAGAVCNTPACQIQGGVNSAGGVQPDNAGDHIHNTLNTVVNIFSMVIGIIAVIVIIIAGLSYITSGGNEQKVSSAKSTLVYAVVGLIIVAFAQIIVRYTIHTSTCDPTNKKSTSCPGYCDNFPKAPSCKPKSSGSSDSGGGSTGATNPHQQAVP